MIGMLIGEIALIGNDEAIINVGGVGYLVKCGSKTLSRLSVGSEAVLHIETHVREQAITLFGFVDEEERAWFVRLQKVQKLGPKAALAILDIMSPSEILSAASLEDKTAFARANGVGPALAGRIIVELAGKPPPQGRGISGTMPGHYGEREDEVCVAANNSGLQNDAVLALTGLGIDESKARRAIAKALSDDKGLLSDENLSLNDLVKQALKNVGT